MENYYIKTDRGLFYILGEWKLPPGMTYGPLWESKGKDVRVGQFILVPAQQQEGSPLPQVPEQLEVIQTNTVDLIDHIYGGNWQNAASSMGVIQLNQSELAPLLQKAEVPQELIDSMTLNIHMLEQLVRQQDKDQALYYANQLTEDLAQIFSYFETSFPAELNHMEYLSRQIILQADYMDWMEASASFSELHNTWEEIRPLLEEQPPELLEGVDGAINQVGAAVSDRSYQNTMDSTELLMDRIDELKASLEGERAEIDERTEEERSEIPQ